MLKRMRSDSVRGYQQFVFDSFKTIFGENEVEQEWNAAKNSEDDFTRELYCPRLDMAVGPFNISRNVYEDNLHISQVLDANRNLIKKLWEASELKGVAFARFMEHKNGNPRCMLAIEIENSGSSKHMLGNIANVSILGAIGIVIPFNEKKLALCKRMKKYVTFATEVEKIHDVFKNVLIVSKEKFRKVISETNMQ